MDRSSPYRPSENDQVSWVDERYVRRYGVVVAAVGEWVDVAVCGSDEVEQMPAANVAVVEYDGD